MKRVRRDRTCHQAISVRACGRCAGSVYMHVCMYMCDTYVCVFVEDSESVRYCCIHLCLLLLGLRSAENRPPVVSLVPALFDDATSGNNVFLELTLLV